ncbi:GAF domain-containing protein [Synechocystis sp. LKSZ1]|uniref:GAF domain-containing protein n=1 Tax=Synechocystis sp. LKSZ1 TaxID=3144951 RepID=UPI00336C0C56
MISPPRHQALLTVVSKIRESLSLEKIFQTTALEVRQLLEADRVGIYRFIPDSQGRTGEFVAEDVRIPFAPLGGRQITDHCFANEYGDAYRAGKRWVVTDLEAMELPVCHQQLLASLGFRANVVVALVAGGELWGLLTLHQCAQPRQWQAEELDFIDQVALHLGVAIQQAELLAQQQQQAQALAQMLERSQVTEKIVDKIRRSLELNPIFQTVTQDVLSVLQADRVLIVQFTPETSGVKGRLVAEAMAVGVEPLALAKILPKTWPYVFPKGSRGNTHYACEDSQRDEIDDYQRYLFQELGIRAFLAVTLFTNDQAWGLLCIQQCHQPRPWQAGDLEFVTKIASHLGIALQQVELLRQARNQAASLEVVLVQAQQQRAEQIKALQRERAVSEVIDKIRRTLDLDTIFQTTVTEVGQLLQTDQVLILHLTDEDNPCPQGQFISEALHPNDCHCHSALGTSPHLSSHWFQHFSQGLMLAIDDTQEPLSFPHLPEFLAGLAVRAVLVVPLWRGNDLWGLLCINDCHAPRRWQSSEIEFVLKIALNLGVALQQAELLAETQKRYLELQQALAKVQVQKEHLARIAEEERTLARVVDRIRQTLDLTTIFQTTTEEVRHLLSCDRVLVYRFEADWSGHFLYESVASLWRPLITAVGAMPTWQDTYLQEHQGGRYRHQDIFVIDDIEQASLSDCHLAILRDFQVRAFIIVPVFVREKLWGLLGVYQNEAPRHWQERETSLLRQIANQLGVAVYQAQLLHQVREQSQDLENTLIDLNAIVDNLVDGLLVTDVAGRVTRFNPALQAMFNLIGTDLKGLQLEACFPLALAALAEPHNLDSPPVRTAEVALGQGRIGQAIASQLLKPSSNGKEECLGSVIMIRDVTREREVDRMKTDFLATVSHELRTPLTSVLGFASVIQTKLQTVIFPALDPHHPKLQKTVQKIDQNLQIIVAEAERLTDLINDVLDIAKMESGNLEWCLGPRPLLPILERAMTTVEPLFSQKSLRLQADFSPDLPLVLVDENRILQVLLNLLSNAIKFTEQGIVRCCAEQQGDVLQVTVADSGRGIPKTEQAKIFDPFYQGGNVLTNKPQGTGLGLPICRQIIEHHGGQIWVESEPGQGSQFHFTLPLYSPESPPGV